MKAMANWLLMNDSLTLMGNLKQTLCNNTLTTETAEWMKAAIEQSINMSDLKDN